MAIANRKLTKKEIDVIRDEIKDIVGSTITGSTSKVVVDENIIKGIVPKGTQRSSIVTRVEMALKRNPFLKELDVKIVKQRSVTIGKKTVSSGSMVIKISFADSDVVFAVAIKPGTAMVSLLPSDLGVTGEMTFDVYKRVVLSGINSLPEDKAPQDFKDFLTDVFEYSLGKGSKVDKMPERLHNYVVDEVLSDISKTFSEVLGPALIKRSGENVLSVIFPISKNERAYDFKVITKKKSKEKVLMSYSVKSGIAKKTNTVKPGDIVERLKKNMIRLNSVMSIRQEANGAQLGKEILETLAKFGRTEGAIEAAKLLDEKTKPSVRLKTLLEKRGKKTELEVCVSFLENATDLDFQTLLSIAFQDELSFMTFVLHKNGTGTFKVTTSDDIEKLDDPLSLRSKGFVPTSNKTVLKEKMGVEAPK